MRSRSSWRSDGWTEQRQALGRGLRCLGQVDVHPERRELVVGDRVEHPRPDVVLLAESLGQAVAVLGHADRVLVVDVHGTVGHRWGRDAFEVGGQERGVVLTLLGPGADLGQLDTTDGGVDVGHAVVETDDLVLVRLLHSLVAIEAQEPLDLGGGHRDHATLTGGHVLRRVQREHREGAEGTDRRPMQ